MSFFDMLWRSLQRQFLRKLYFYSLIWPKVIFTLYFPFTITSAEMNYIGFDRAFQVQRSAIITKYILKLWGKLVPSYVHWSAPFVKCGLFRLWRWDPAMGESNAHQTAQYLHILTLITLPVILALWNSDHPQVVWIELWQNRKWPKIWKDKQA